MRHLHAPLRHIRSNIVACLALVVAVGGSGSYALAAVSASNGTVAVCVDKGSGVMHLAKHPRCGHGQSRIGLSSALDRPTVGALVAPNGGVTSGLGLSIGHAGAGVYDVTITAARCRGALNNAPVVSVNESQPPGGWAQASSRWPGQCPRGSAGTPSRSLRGSLWLERSSRATRHSTSRTHANLHREHETLRGRVDAFDARCVGRGDVRSAGRRGGGATTTTNRDHALERVRPAHGLHGWNWSIRVVKSSSVLWGRSAHVGLQPREHTSARSALAVWRRRHGRSALLSAWSARSVPDGPGSVTCLRPLLASRSTTCRSLLSIFRTSPTAVGGSA